VWVVIRFTKHALEKFEKSKIQGIKISPETIARAIHQPRYLEFNPPYYTAHTKLGKNLIVRMVYTIENDSILIITFYPAKTSQYEKF
jgi:hypothetical protein